MSEELDPKKIEEINARKAEGVGIDKSENDEFEKKLDFVKQLTEKQSITSKKCSIPTRHNSTINFTIKKRRRK